MNYMTSGNVTVCGGSNYNELPGADNDQLAISAFNSVTPTFNEVYDVYKDHVHLGEFYSGGSTVTGIDVSHCGIEDVTLSGPATKTGIYNVHSTMFNSTTHVFTGWKGGDMIYVGDGKLDNNIAGNLDLKGYYGFNDFVTINDDKAAAGNVYMLSENVLKTLQTRSITLPQGAHLELNTTNYADKISVAGGYSFQVKSFSLNSNGGDDQVFFGEKNLQLRYMQNIPLSIDCGDGNDRIVMQDGYNNTGGAYHLIDHHFYNDYGVSSMSYWRTETFAVGGSLTSNTFDIVPSPTTKYQLYGHLLTPNLGGQTWLSIGTDGVTKPIYHNLGSGAGQYTFGNRAPIDFWQMTNYPTSFNQGQPFKLASPQVLAAKLAGLFSDTRIL